MKQLNFWNKRTPREKFLLSTVLVLLLLVGGYRLILEGQIDEFLSLPGTLPSSINQLEQARAKVKTLTQAEINLQISQRQLQEALGQFQSEVYPGAMVVRVGEAAKASKVNVKLFIPRPKVSRPEKEKFIDEIPVDMVVEGTFDNLMSFWSRLEGLGANAIVRRFAITWETSKTPGTSEASPATGAATSSTGKLSTGNSLLDLIGSLIVGSATDRVNASIAQASPNKGTAERQIRLPRAKYQPKLRGPTPTLNAAFSIAFFEVGKGGTPDDVDLTPYGSGRSDPFEPLVWDDKNVWLYPEPQSIGNPNQPLPNPAYNPNPNTPNPTSFPSFFPYPFPAIPNNTQPGATPNLPSNAPTPDR